MIAYYAGGADEWLSPAVDDMFRALWLGQYVFDNKIRYVDNNLLSDCVYICVALG